MVYCGKPSKGCGACRARKVKCDQATPACKRCLKSNRVCPGYRDQLSLLFRDESSAVAQKAKSAAAPHDRKSNYYVSPSPGTSSFNSEPSTEFDFVSTSIQTSPYSTGSFENPEYGDDDECAPLALMPLSADRRQQAICFCFSNFRWLNQSLSGFNIDADVSSTATVAEKAMMKGIVAVGMASISRLGPSSQSMKMQAQREYYDALKLTNAAISRPKQAIEDATLTAVLCMSLFEIVTSRKPERIDAFIEHTRGATALLELRGEDQLVRSQGLEMFQFLRNEIIVSCIMRDLPIPPALLLLSEKATLLPNAPYISKLSHEVCVITARINEIRIEDLRSRHASLDTSILSRALALDSEIETMVNNRLSSEIIPQIYTSAPGQFFGNVEHIAPFEGVYHTYDSFFGAMVANNLRDARLFIIGIIFNCYSRMIRQGHFIPPPEFKEHCYRLRDVARELARDICATVPFLCGYIDASDPNLNGRKIISTSGGLALLFPLFIAASVDGYGSACSDWVAQCFSLIGREMGIDQALALVDILPTEQGMPEFVDSL